MWNFVMFLRLHSEINPQTSSLRGLVGRRVSGDHCWGICRKFVNISSIYPPLGQDNYRDLTLRHGLFGYAKLKGCDFQQLSVNAEQTQHLVGYLEHTSAITCTDLSSTIPDGAAWGAHSSFIVYILSFIVTNGAQLREDKDADTNSAIPSRSMWRSCWFPGGCVLMPYESIGIQRNVGSCWGQIPGIRYLTPPIFIIVV